jgi:hypothetical protein
MNLGLRTLTAELKPVKKKTKLFLEASALIRQAEPAPILLENVEGSRVLANILPDRDTLARRLGVPPKNFLSDLGRRLGKGARRPAPARSTARSRSPARIGAGCLS